MGAGTDGPRGLSRTPVQALAGAVLRLCGWQAVCVPPPGPKTVVLVYPHTSNWDFPLGMLFRFSQGLKVAWAGKDSLFRPPFGGLFRRLGGIPIDRRQPTGTTARLAAAFRENDTLHLCIAPEGTRARTDHWKSGFYHLARRAGLPVGLGFIDYRRKRLGIECWIELTGDPAVDLAAIGAFYADKTARYPEQAGPVRFRER